MREPVALTPPGPYATAVADVARDLGAALARLDALAARPGELDEAAAQLAQLQYRLHTAGEALLSLVPPLEAAERVRELGDALVAAREATGAVGLTLERGEPLGSLVYEWRGALFRARLARAELAREAPAHGGRLGSLPWPRIHGLVLLLLALGAVTVGAREGAWLVVAGGAAAVALGAALLLRP
jgi:hypothetical protein